MNGFDAASLTDALLVVKGAATPTSPPQRLRRSRPIDGRPRVGLRLDDERWRRLKIASIHLRKSTQAMLLAALDNYFERVVPSLVDESCACLRAGGVGGATCVTMPLRPR